MTEREYGLAVPELIEIFCLTFLWLVVLVRIPTIRGRNERTMWSALLLGATSMSLQITFTYELAVHLVGRDLLGINRDIVADVIGLFAAAAIFSFVLKVVGKDQYARLTYGAALVVTATLLLINHYFDQRTPTGSSQDSAAGTVYWLVLLLYHFVANSWCSYICWRCFARTRSSPLRVALPFFSVGTAMAALYMLVSLIHFFIPINSIARFFPLVRATEALLYGAAAAVPIVTSMSRWVRASAWLSQLYPLWRDITKSVDGLTLHKPRGYLLYLFLACTDQRQGLYRKIIEIQDGILELKRYVPAETLLAATHYVQAQNLGDNDVRAAATACWITSALHNRSQDHQTLADHEDQPQQSASLSTEAAHLSKVAFFYSSPLPTQFGAFLRQAQNVPHTNQNPSITQA